MCRFSRQNLHTDHGGRIALRTGQPDNKQLEDWVTKLVAADEISAYVEPRRAMAVLSHVGKPLQAQDTLFMTEWVAIFRESGLRDDVSVENLREACLQLVVCARARARELQVDVQVERASRAVVAANTVTPNKGKSTPAMESAVCKFFPHG